MEVERPERKVAFRLGCLRQADGSAECRTDKARIMAAVFGPVPVKTKQEKTDGATIQVSVETLCSPPDLESNALAVRLEEALERIILRSMHPRSLITIGIQPMNLCGSASPAEIFAASFNAAIAALIDAAIPLMAIPLAIALGAHSHLIMVGSGGEEKKGDASLSQLSLTLHDGASILEIGQTRERGRVECEAISTALQQAIHASYVTK